ncbi:MAG TPA: peptide chain release factor 2 [Chlamydiales bacterium]|nr:peptide chain release factor 2 [Chlamydiales bacterium]
MEKKENQVQQLEKKMEASSFWDDPDEAKKVMKEVSLLKGWVQPFNDLKNRMQDLKDLYPEAESSGDEELLHDLDQEFDRIEESLSQLEIKKMLSGELDDKGCFISINAGAGGTESCDWVSMLMRMYERWASKRGWKVEVIDKEDGDVAGIKSITMKVTGDFAYGYAKSEKGVHRLVRISPFDSNARRHTSFASVDVSPVIEDDVNIEISPEEIRIDTFRASGAGGQHVNVTDSAVRITHIPTKIVVSCQNERSQLQNKETCMNMLKSKLYEQKILEREEKLKQLSGEKKEIAWGSQIRSYTFQPYTLVKDTRTKAESGNIQAVMDGDIDIFVNAYLKEFG